MLTQVALVRAQPVNRSGAASYVGNPALSHELVAAGEATDAAMTQDLWNAGWTVYRITTDTNVYVKTGSVATAAPRYLMMAGEVLDIVMDKPANVFIAVA